MAPLLCALFDSKEEHRVQTRSHGAEIIRRMCVSILAGTTSQWLRDSITPDAVVAGLAARIIFVRSDRKMIKINFAEILYIESLSDYIKIHLTDKTVITRETITGIEAKLPKNDFIRRYWKTGKE